MARKKIKELSELKKSGYDTVYQFYLRFENAAKVYGFEFGAPAVFPKGKALHCLVEGSRINIKIY